MEEYQSELKRQSDAIKNQQPVIDAIQRTKLRQDLFIDTSILILSIYTANSFLIEYPLHVAGQILMRDAPKPRRKFSRQAAKAIIVWILMKKYPNRAFLFFEAPPIHEGSTARSRRIVEYVNGNQDDYNSDDIPVQWMAWLRHTRVDPPTVEVVIDDWLKQEILAADAQRLKTQQLARGIEEKDVEMRLKEQEDVKRLTESLKDLKQREASKDGPEAWSPSASRR
ncbi:UNVERIFIED_CONTAM: hypothetical protein HDU68_000130 [Siphonaria sp. JEL0065]|nr:hypothetical protein HDU68_000130 [Siphonaria sp. JEL0065]